MKSALLWNEDKRVARPAAKSGLLWYDADPRKTIWRKIEEAAKRYEDKYGTRPNVAFVNPNALTEQQPDKFALNVAPKSTILPNHVWVSRVAES